MAAWPYPDPADDGQAAHLRPGRRMLDELLPYTGGAEMSLAELPGRFVVFIYPWAGRPGVPNPPGWDDIPGAHGSTPEAAGFRDHYDRFNSIGVGIMGVSGQALAEQEEFAARLSLPFDLASDGDGTLRKGMMLPKFVTGGVTYLKRLTLVLNDGVISRVIYPVHPPDAHAASVLAMLAADQQA
jgi:peroxiredoxin